ncbi:MAG TPA: sigma 54-interacting transcriptional regulator [Desulfobacterales bacterium]|nr:sigma 54-interacting transcriptional regulator [Desulfobacterales bacterium]
MATDFHSHLPRPDAQVTGGLDWKTFSRALLNATRHAVFVVEPGGTVVISNRAVQDKLGLFPGTLVSTTLPDFWPEITRCLSTQRDRRGIPMSHNAAALLAEISPMRWKSGVIGALCILEDVTNLKEVTRQMVAYQELNRELDAIIDSSHDGLWICDGNAQVVRINPASARINQVRAEEVVGRNMRDLVAEGFVNQSVTLRVLETRQQVNLLQQTRQGRKLMLTGNPVFDQDGRLIRVVVNERDVTEIDNLQRELENQEAIKNQFRHQILEMQLAEVEANRIIARSPCFLNLLKQALKVSSVESTVLIQGESGSGKGVIADLIHKYSIRSDHPMIKINCGAIPETLVESELFGYDSGAFTGARRQGKAGYFEVADGGILFLDEIAELPLSCQVKLLHFLEDGHITRVGSTAKRRLNVRILAATNQDLKAMVAAKRFRADLYFRLHVIPLNVPPLRERRECLLALIRHFTADFARKLADAPPPRISQAALERLLAYGYPGNVRELMNICERLVVLAEGSRIEVDDLPASLGNPACAAASDSGHWSEGRSLQQIVESVEREVLAKARMRLGKQAAIAEALHINQSTVARKLQKYGL